MLDQRARLFAHREGLDPQVAQPKVEQARSADALGKVDVRAWLRLGAGALCIHIYAASPVSGDVHVGCVFEIAWKGSAKPRLVAAPKFISGWL